MAQQPQRLRVCRLQWLLYRVLGICGLLVLPVLGPETALGLELDVDEPAPRALQAPLEAVPEVLGELPVSALPERTPAWHGGLLKMLSHRRASRQVLRAPVPSAEAICASLEAVLPYFDLAADQLPPHLRQRLCQRIRKYAVRYRRDVQAMLYRADDYLPMIKRALREHGLPTYYAYVPLVESAFEPDAKHGGSGARGLWQLLSNTARAV